MRFFINEKRFKEPHKPTFSKDSISINIFLLSLKEKNKYRLFL